MKIALVLVLLAGCGAAPPYVAPAPLPPLTLHRISQPQQQAPAQTQGPQASWTGQSRMAQTVTGQPGMTCQYNYAGNLFWRTFAGSCPAVIGVQ